MLAERDSASTCPVCSEPTVGGGRTVLWCPACDWNVDPHPPAQPTSRRARWATRASARMVDGLYDEVVRDSDSPRRRDPAGLLAVTLAVGVHLLTLAMLALGVAALLTLHPWWLGVAFAALPLAIGVLLLPRPESLPAGVRRLTEAEAPTLHELIQQVALVVGAPMPHVVGVNSEFNAFVSRIGWRQQRVLVLGLPLWDCLEGPSQSALLGHELGHEVNGDPRRGLLVGSALNALAEWYHLTRQSPTGFSGGPGGASPGTTLASFGSMASRWILAVVGLVPRWAHFWLLALTQRSSQRAEYRADLIGARVAGPAGVAQLQERVVLRESYDIGVRRAAMSGQRDVTASGRAQALSLPLDEVRRLLRVEALRPRGVFDSHPPHDLRHRLALSLAAAPPRVQVDEACSQRIASELGPYLKATSVALRNAATWQR